MQVSNSFAHFSRKVCCSSETGTDELNSFFYSFSAWEDSSLFLG